MCIASIGYAQDRQSAKKAPAKEQRGSDANPISVKVLPAQDVEADARKREEDNKRDAYWASRVEGEHRIGTATWALFWVTFALAGFTAALWWATYRLMREAKDTSKKQLRAYVFVKPELPINIPKMEEWHTRGMKFLMHNNGQTPAFNLQQLTIIALKEKDIQIKLDAVKMEDGGSSLVLTPGMHSEQMMRATAPIVAEDIAKFRAGTHAVYVWGEAHYKDVFGEHHVTRYAFQIDGEGRESGRTHWCKHGNEST